MAFWGVEVKPGKPFTHLPDSIGGRLHVSQATLGFGTATKKSVVQCNVGNKSPVFLCSLFPDRAESCQMNLEFEEVDEVVLSVLGPRSVHLTGFYLGTSLQYKRDDESESYGEDIVETDQERSDDVGIGDEDDYEDSFIDDDDLQVIPQSHLSDEVDEDTNRGGRKKGGKVKHRRLRKKYQSTQTDDEDNSEQQAFSYGGVAIIDSECEDMETISSLVKSAARSREPGAQEKAEKGGGQKVATDNELKRKPHEDNDPKQKKKMRKKPKEEKEVKSDEADDFFAGDVLLWKNQKKFDQSRQDTALKNGDSKKSGNDNYQTDPDEAMIVKVARDSLLKSDEDEKQANDEGVKQLHSDELVHENVSKPGKRKKKMAKEEKVLEVDNTLSNNNTEDQAPLNEASCENIVEDSMLKSEEHQKQSNNEGENTLHASPPSGDLINGIDAKTGEEKNKQVNETKFLGADMPFDTVHTEDQSQPDEATCVKVAQDGLLKSDDVEKLANNEEKKAKTGKRKQEQVMEEKALVADSPCKNFSREYQAQTVEAKRESLEQGSLLKSEDNQKQANDEGVKLLQSDELVRGKVTKPVRKKKKAKEENVLKVDNTSSNIDGLDQALLSKASCENIVEDDVLKNEEHQKQSNNENTVLECSLPLPAVVTGAEIVLEQKKKRKKPGKNKALDAEANNIKLSSEENANGDEQNIGIISSDADNNDNLPDNEDHNVKRKKKKRVVHENGEALNINSTVSDIKENNANGKSKTMLRSKKYASP